MKMLGNFVHSKFGQSRIGNFCSPRQFLISLCNQDFGVFVPCVVTCVKLLRFVQKLTSVRAAHACMEEPVMMTS